MLRFRTQRSLSTLPYCIISEGFLRQVTRILMTTAISTNGLPDNFSAQQTPTRCRRSQSHVTARCAIVRGVWRGMVDFSTSALCHPCHQPHQPRCCTAGYRKMPLALRATSATRPLSPRPSTPSKDDLEVEPQQRLCYTSMDRKLALLLLVFTPRDTA
jgi:hypothetical protein